jgi:hypothetical protein
MDHAFNSGIFVFSSTFVVSRPWLFAVTSSSGPASTDGYFHYRSPIHAV